MHVRILPAWPLWIHRCVRSYWSKDVFSTKFMNGMKQEKDRDCACAGNFPKSCVKSWSSRVRDAFSSESPFPAWLCFVGILLVAVLRRAKSSAKSSLCVLALRSCSNYARAVFCKLRKTTSSDISTSSLLLRSFSLSRSLSHTYAHTHSHSHMCVRKHTHNQTHTHTHTGSHSRARS